MSPEVSYYSKDSDNSNFVKYVIKFAATPSFSYFPQSGMYAIYRSKILPAFASHTCSLSVFFAFRFENFWNETQKNLKGRKKKCKWSRGRETLSPEYSVHIPASQVMNF